MFVITNRQTGTVVKNTCKTVKSARIAVDKLDAKYGASVHSYEFSYENQTKSNYKGMF